MDNSPASSEKDELFAQLENLKKLHSAGYVTDTEFSERKAQLVDTLTGTSSTSTKTTIKWTGPEIVNNGPPNFAKIQSEDAIMHTFDIETGNWDSEKMKVKIDTVPFAKGALRVCYYVECSFNNNKEIFVAKLSMDPNEDREIYFTDVEMQMYCQDFAKKFNAYNPPNSVDFVSAWLIELCTREGNPLCAVEQYISGDYVKHNNNSGYVDQDERNTPQAFSHFTYEASGHKILIVDIQGVGDLYTDPQMHTLMSVPVGTGKGNLGAKGFQKFFESHQCNAICRYLRLPPINAKRFDIGTIPAQPVMPSTRVAVVNVDSYASSTKEFAAKVNAQEPLLPGKKKSESCCIIL